MKITELIGQHVESVSWNDLDMLRPCEPLIFLDFGSVDLIKEWVIFNRKKKKIKSSMIKLSPFGNSFFYSVNKKRDHHSPSPIWGLKEYKSCRTTRTWL